MTSGPTCSKPASTPVVNTAPRTCPAPSALRRTVQLQADNPDLHFIVPESGATTFVDTMVIPYTTQNQKAAEAWINYVYDRPNYAKLIAFVQYVPVLSDMTDELNKIDPKLASNPL